jgi:double-stranded RNA-binding protein Staufen
MTQQQQPTSNFQVVKKKTRNLIKEKLEQSTNADEINPISQLIQIQQARKEKEPTYVVVDERGTARRREFVIEVSVSGYSANGTGPNKKLAKKIAAENLLIAMGVNASKPVTETPIIEKKKMIDMSDKGKKVQFNEPDAGKKTPAKSTSGSGGRQIVPGLLLVSNTETFSTPTKPVATTSSSTSSKDTSSLQSTEHPTVAEKQSSSPNSNASNADSGIGENGVSPRDQLNYLAQLIGFSVSYADFPKANHTEFLSLVTLSTDPPHMGHGNGSTVDESRDSAALKALSVISELGIDNVKPKGSK